MSEDAKKYGEEEWTAKDYHNASHIAAKFSWPQLIGGSDKRILAQAFANERAKAEKKMRAVVEIGREILDYIPLPDEIEARLDACIEEAERLMKGGGGDERV